MVGERTKMKSAVLLGDRGALPFMGHIRAKVVVDDAVLWAAARTACGGDVVLAHESARNLQETIERVTDRFDVPPNRNDLIRGVWEALKELTADQLGSSAGSDLQLLMTAQDPEGVGIAGVGLSMVWGVMEDGLLQPLVSEDHPLLSYAGLPEQIPGVLTLDRPVLQVVGIPDHLPSELPADFELRRDCGWRS